MDCVVDCSKPNVLSVRGPKWKFSHPVYASLLLAGLFAFIGASQLVGKWQTKPAMVSFTDNSGKLDPDNIRGWMTLAEISSGYGVPLDRLYTSSGLPARIPATARLNSVARDFKVNFEPDKVRDVVRGYLAGNPLPPPEESPALQDSARPAQKKDHASGGEEEVKGFMTLNEVAMETGVPRADLLQSLGITVDIDPRSPVREWMHAQDRSIQDLRDAVKQYRAGLR